MNKRDLINYLEANYNDDDDIVRCLWCMDDILGQAESMGYQMTVEQGRQVIAHMEHKQDACVGINWDFIEEAIRHCIREYGWQLPPVASDDDEDGPEAA